MQQELPFEGRDAARDADRRDPDPRRGDPAAEPSPPGSSTDPASGADPSNADEGASNTDHADSTDAGSDPAAESPSPRPTAQPRHSRFALHAMESLQTILTALLLAFVFRAFFVEAFIIPTGSMAPALRGEHCTFTCPHCAWEFDFGPSSTGFGSQVFQMPRLASCPNCQRTSDVEPETTAVKSGDRILVHKWPYALGGWFGPRRWDVIVFRDPSNPRQNYIKRVVALPEEGIEIIDGDVFIQPPRELAFQIARKPPHAQAALWSVVFAQDYMPRLDQRDPNRWRRMNPDPRRGGWTGLERRVLRYHAADLTPRRLRFDPIGSNSYFRDVYGYNHGTARNFVGDGRLQAQVRLRPSIAESRFRWELERGDWTFALEASADGVVRLLARAGRGGEEEWGRLHLPALARGERIQLGLAHLDWQVFVEVNGERRLVSTAEQYGPPPLRILRQRRRVGPLRVELTAAGDGLTLRHLRIDRDVHYSYSPRDTRRAYAGEPFSLGEAEYFVLGDNSPNSHDSREWYQVGEHLEQAYDDGAYALGTVPADQIVGQAFFVYLPGLLPVDPGGRWRLPDFGRIRFIR